MENYKYKLTLSYPIALLTSKTKLEHDAVPTPSKLTVQISSPFCRSPILHLVVHFFLYPIFNFPFLIFPVHIILIVPHPPYSLPISLSLRCSSCCCLAGRESCGCRSGMCPSLTRRGRRSPETWSRQYWPGSPRCAASWSGGTSRLFTRGQ